MSITPLLGWRDYLHVRPDKIRGDAEYYLTQAQEIRASVAQVLTAGLSEGALQALSDLAEEDSVDFCIMVDLANEVDIPGVEPLSKDQAEKLRQFLNEEPWHSLMADTEIAVTLAILRAYGENEDETIWRMGDPHLLRSISHTFQYVNTEQLGRLVSEINALDTRLELSRDNELCALMLASCAGAADRLGVQTPTLFNREF